MCHGRLHNLLRRQLDLTQSLTSLLCTTNAAKKTNYIILALINLLLSITGCVLMLSDCLAASGSCAKPLCGYSAHIPMSYRAS